MTHIYIWNSKQKLSQYTQLNYNSFIYQDVKALEK